MSDPFRDDLEAALARVDVLARDKTALEADVARLTAELAEAHAKAARWDAQETAAERKRAKAKAKADKAREDARAAGKHRLTTDQRESRRSLRNFALAAGAIVTIVGALSIPDCQRKRAHERWEAAHAARTHELARWEATVALADCVRATEIALHDMVGLDAETTDPRGAHPRSWSRGDGAVRGCSAAVLHTLATDPAVPAQPRQIIAAWEVDVGALAAVESQLEDYYGRGDWKDDSYASAAAKWRAFRAAGDALARDIQIARAAARPWAIAEVTRRRDALPRDSEAWWQLELFARIEAINDELHLVEQGGGVDRALLEDTDALAQARADARALVDEAKQAPLAVRRELRARAALDQLATTKAWVPGIDNPPVLGASLPPEEPEPSNEGCGGGAD